MTPEELRNIMDGTGLNAVEMGEIMCVGYRMVYYYLDGTHPIKKGPARLLRQWLVSNGDIK